MLQENNSMIDRKIEIDVQFGSSDRDKWYDEHVLSEEQLKLLIKDKFDRYKSYRTANKNLVL